MMRQSRMVKVCDDENNENEKKNQTKTHLPNTQAAVEAVAVGRKLILMSFSLSCLSL